MKVVVNAQYSETKEINVGVDFYCLLTTNLETLSVQ